MPRTPAGPPAAAIVASGDELVRGRSRDTNSPEIAAALSDAGWRVTALRVVGDDLPALGAALREATRRARAVIVTGGLGPTADDLTRVAVARLLRAPLEEHAPTLRRLRALWRRRGAPMPVSNRLQAAVPRGASVLPNPAGSAPGLRFTHGGAEVFCLPGVPREMRAMLAGSVIPALRRISPGTRAAAAWLSCFGVSESEAGERIADLMGRDRDVRVGTSVADGVLRIGVHGSGGAAADVAAVAGEVARRLEPHVFSRTGEDPGEATTALLRRLGLTAAVAESCTAGLVAARLADLPGSSSAFLGGVVAYADAAKRELLGVPAALLERHGAVSGEVAAAMARGARGRFRSDLAVAVTGIAGPDGATPTKPVGLVWLAVASARGVRAEERCWSGTRAHVRSVAANAALDLLRREALAVPAENG